MSGFEIPTIDEKVLDCSIITFPVLFVVSFGETYSIKDNSSMQSHIHIDFNRSY